MDYLGYTNTAINTMRETLLIISNLQEKDKKNNEKLINIINNIKKDIEYVYRLIKLLGFEDISELYSLEKIYKDNKNKYIQKGNIYDLFNKIINVQNETDNFLINEGFNDINELKIFISKNKNIVKNNIIEKPVKVTFNNAYYNKYLKLLLNKKDEEIINIKSNNKNFVLYRFKNIIKKVIYNNKKILFNQKVNNSILYFKLYKASMLPQKVTLNNAYYDRFKMERINNNINKFKFTFNKIIINNRIKKFVVNYRKQKKKAINALNNNKKIINDIIKSNNKYNKSSVYDILYKNNRSMIDLYSNYYNTIYLKDKKVDLEIIQEYHDKNKYRFQRMLELFDKIKKDDILYNSKYIFNYYKLSEINKKDDNYKIFLQKLRSELGFKPSGDNRNNKVTLGHALYDFYINNTEKEDSEYDYSGFVSTCIFCDSTEDINENNGICKICIESMNKKDDEYYYSD